MSRSKLLALGAGLAATAATLGCGGDEGATGARSEAPIAPRSARVLPHIGELRAERLRALVLAGARRDFRNSTGRASASFNECFIRRFSVELTDETLYALLEIKQERGQRRTAQALNDVAVSVGDRCGDRGSAPQLISASRRLPRG